tara:strand:- start:1032 stop:2342 length:1311 start_codon:yes stop_codon:yes gene_type:complete
MATINFLYRSTKENEPLNLRLLFRHGDIDYTQGAKTQLYIYSHDELIDNGKLSAKHYWTKLHNKKNVKDIDLENKQTEINLNVNTLKNKILKAFNEADVEDIIRDKNWLKNSLQEYYNPTNTNKDIPSKLVPFFDYYIDKRKNELNSARIKNIKVTKHKLEKLESSLNRKFGIKDINEEFKDLFTNFCNKHQYAKNTQQRELTLIKTICRYARYLGIDTHHQLDSVRLPRQETKHVHLTFEELDTIEELSLPYDYLDNARDWLLISCYVGQRVSDFMRFNSSMIRVENGKQLLEFKQVKTKKLMTIPISKEVRKVLAKRNGEFPRAISDQKYNDYIKDVCKLAAINEMCEGKKRISIAPEGAKPTKSNYRDVVGEFEKWELVSSHIGRRSFATNYYGKVPTTFLINITGHSSEKMFLNYIKKSNKDLALESYDYFN